jgi:serine/threonine protein kinase
VVTIHHIVDSAELQHPWLVMELVPGGSLDDRLRSGPLPLPDAVRVGRGVLTALSAAHAAGILHRDVKPANVLLRRDGTPVLTDFGIAALSESPTLTVTGTLIGSPEYIAPERIRGEEGNPPRTCGRWACCCTSQSRDTARCVATPRWPPSPRCSTHRSRRPCAPDRSPPCWRLCSAATPRPVPAPRLSTDPPDGHSRNYPEWWPPADFAH